MADNNKFYTEGGMPSNMQVCGVRNGRIYSADGDLLIIADAYNLFDLSADEVVLAYGIEVLVAATDGSAVTVTVSDGGGAVLTAVDLKTLGKTMGVVATLDGSGIGADTLTAIITGATDDVDFNVFAIVANVENPSEAVPASVRVPPLV
jgi:hypothetical protein